MATQYTSILKLALPTQGELSGSWGTVVNENITTMVEQAVAGLATINSWSGNSHTLSTANGTTSEARCAMLVADDNSGQPSGAATIICPAATKLYILKNIAGQAVTLKTASGTGIAVPNNGTSILFCDGTNVVEAISNITGALTTGALTVAGDVTLSGTVNVTGDTAAGDDAAIGYTSVEGLILTGQGSTNDITIKNDADADVLEIPTGTTNVTVVGDISAGATLNAGGDTAAGDDAAIGYTSVEGLILTGQGSTNDITIKNDADADVIEVPTGTVNVTMAGTLDVVGDVTGGNFQPDGDTTAGDNAAIGYTSVEGLILTGQGSTNDVTIKNDADADVIEIPTGSVNVTMAGTLDVVGDVTGGNFQPDGDTAVGDTAALGYTSVLGAILTGQGSTNDVTLVNDADGTVLGIPTGTTNVDIVGDVTAANFQPDGDTAAGDTAALGYTNVLGAILTGQGSTNDVTLVNDADATVLGIPTGTTNVDIVGDVTGANFQPDGDTAAGDTAAIGYTNVLGLILTGQGSTNDVTIVNDADATVVGVPTGTTNVTMAGGLSVGKVVTAKTDTDTSNTGNVTLDFATNQNFVLTFTGNVTLVNPSTETVGQSGIIVCIQDGTGSRTLSLGTDYESPAGGGITLSTAANTVDIVPYFVKAANSIQLGAPQLAFS